MACLRRRLPQVGRPWRRPRLTKPDVIVMDITMPDLNGLEATRQDSAGVEKMSKS